MQTTNHLNSSPSPLAITEHLAKEPVLRNQPVHQFTHNKQSTGSLLLEKIGRVTKYIFHSLACVALFWMNPSLFAIGFLAGVVLDAQAKAALQKIGKVWDSQPWSSAFLICIGSLISLPITLAAGSIIASANLGSSMSLQATNRHCEGEMPRMTLEAETG